MKEFNRSIGETPSYGSNLANGVIARKAWEVSDGIAGSLKDLGYSVWLEFHAGFWLVHWTFPKACRDSARFARSN